MPYLTCPLRLPAEKLGQRIKLLESRRSDSKLICRVGEQQLIHPSLVLEFITEQRTLWRCATGSVWHLVSTSMTFVYYPICVASLGSNRTVQLTSSCAVEMIFNRSDRDNPESLVLYCQQGRYTIPSTVSCERTYAVAIHGAIQPRITSSIIIVGM